MAAGEPSGPVVIFCQLLRRLVRECQIPQTDLARALNRSNGAISTLLNGQRTTPPPWDDVARIVEYCRARSSARPPVGLSLDPGWWRLRHHELEITAEQTVPQPRGRKPPAQPRPVEVPVTFADAVAVLVADRDDFEGLAEELLEPLTLNGAVITDLRAVLEGFADRVRSSHGTTRTALLCAADLAVLVTAFCEAVGTSGIRYGAELGYPQGEITTEIVTELERVTLGSYRTRHPAQLREDITAAYTYVADTVLGAGSTQGPMPQDLAHQAWRRYESLLASVTWDCAELRLTSDTEDPPEALDPPSGLVSTTAPGLGLAGLSSLLGSFASAGSAPARMHQPLLRTPIAAAEEPGPVMPTLEAGYVNPAFRTAGYAADPGLSRDDWWHNQPVRDDLEDFLAAHLLTDHATRAPLLILGHPGSGKSLLTKLIAARLPASEYFCQRIELRHLPADLDIQQQLEDALLRTTGLRTAWPEATDPSADTLRVVLLDGLDELLQAAADHIDPARHYNYLHDVAQFQQRETDHGRPTVVIVTSRTVVADQVLTPHLSTVIRLESLDEDRIRRWLDIWNATNRRYFTTHDLQPLTWAAVEPHRDLASQPLLLLMLALYDASHNALRHLHGADIGRIGLYERLLTEFVRRQLTKEHRALPAHAQAAAVEHELQRLAVIAIGMFNRRSQAITATTAQSDLSLLLGTPPPEPSPLLFGRFFFVHEAQATVTGEEHRSYEFLHATFGEYLLTRLITGELHDLAAAHTIDRSAPVDDGRLYALLSHVPLTDRAEVLRNTSDLLTLLSEPQRAYLITLLSHLFQHVPGDTSHRTHLPYPTASVHRTRQDAIYSANLLLLAVLAHDGTRASHLLGPHNTLDLWRRSTQLWRSQLSDASWDTYTRTLTAQPFTDPETRTRDLRIDLCQSTPGQDLAWAVNLATSDDTPAVVRHTEDTDPTDLHRSAAFMHDTSTQHLLHALAPLLHRLPTAPQTFHALDSQHSSSAAHALISLLFRTAPTPREPQAPYTEIFTLLQALPGDERPLAADILARHIFHAASGMPAAAVTELLDQLTMTRFTASGGLTAQTWLILAQCLNHLAGRPDTPHDQLKKITERFSQNAAPLGNAGTPLIRLLCLLTEADTTHVWHGADHYPAVSVLTDALALIHQIPPESRPPHAIIATLRLAHDLAAHGWLDDHGEPLLQTLTREGLHRLRPTDVEWLRPLVGDETLLAELELITHRWREP